MYYRKNQVLNGLAEDMNAEPVYKISIKKPKKSIETERWK